MGSSNTGRVQLTTGGASNWFCGGHTFCTVLHHTLTYIHRMFSLCSGALIFTPVPLFGLDPPGFLPAPPSRGHDPLPTGGPMAVLSTCFSKPSSPPRTRKVNRFQLVYIICANGCLNHLGGNPNGLVTAATVLGEGNRSVCTSIYHIHTRTS